MAVSFIRVAGVGQRRSFPHEHDRQIDWSKCNAMDLKHWKSNGNDHPGDTA
jgi:hypothetical protein